MNKKERAQIVETILSQTFPNPTIPLDHTDAFTLLIAVLLSAQCTDARVNKTTPTLFAKASTPEEMAALPVKTIEKSIHPCGLAPTKAKHIRALSKILIEKHKGKVPQTLKELEALPGVGRKTASVILCQAFGKAAFPVDTHIHRCAKRWGLSSGKDVAATERDLKKLFPKAKWKTLHLQMILYARTYCPARAHKADECPLCHELTASSEK